jgi:uncharacterized membrane protein HdeD (DUF308 family)
VGCELVVRFVSPAEGEKRMSLPIASAPANVLDAEREHLGKNWFWLLLLGILLIVVGLGAIAHSVLATLASVIILGALFLVGGGMEIVNAFLARRWRGFWMHLLAGILYLVLGFFLMQQPLEMAIAFTLVLAVMFFVGGIFRVVLALVERFEGWGWVLVNGVVTLVLGILIWRQWPEASFWVIGLFVGIDLLFDGWSWVMTALAVRGLAKKAV